MMQVSKEYAVIKFNDYELAIALEAIYTIIRCPEGPIFLNPILYNKTKNLGPFKLQI